MQVRWISAMSIARMAVDSECIRASTKQTEKTKNQQPPPSLYVL